MNDIFLKDSLDEITEKHFKATCVAAMSDQPELKGLLGVPCGDDYYLYSGKGKSLVYVSNWSNMLSLHIVTEGGTWLVSSHIDGRSVEEVLEEAWRQFLSAKPFIKTSPEKAFRPVKFSEGTGQRWMKWTEEYMEFIKNSVDVYNLYRNKRVEDNNE